MDPLSILRKVRENYVLYICYNFVLSKGALQATSNGIKIEHVDNHYVIGEHKFEENTPTCFKSSSIKIDFYTIRDVVFFLENAELSIVESRAKAQALGINPVMTQDKADLMAFLTEDVDTCAQIDHVAMDKWAAGIFSFPFSLSFIFF